VNDLAFDRPLLLVLLAAIPLALSFALVSNQERTRGARLFLASILRALTLALVALAAAGPSFVRGVERESVVFVLDASASTRPAGVAEGLQKIETLGAALDARTQAGLVAVADDARVVVALADKSDFIGQLAKARGGLLARGSEAGLGPASLGENATDLARGLRLAEALVAPGAPAKIVLLSDGRETRGSARDEATRLRTRGVAVDTVAIPSAPPRDARVVEVSLGSPEVREGEGLLVRVTVASTRAGRVRVVLERDGETKPEWERVHDLEADRPETLAFTDRADRRGLRLYEARVELEGDEEPRNDRGGCAVLVRGGPEALVVETADEGEAVARILDAQGFRVRRVRPKDVPQARELDSIDLVVLAGAPLLGPDALPPGRAKELERFVREGGGLLALGGTSSYALGGWQDSELEAALPVRMDPPSRGEQPSVALVIAIDKSGSMRGPKIELAKLAAKSATTGLSRKDQLGIIAFNFNAYWIVPLSPLTQPAKIRDKIDFQIAGGGTDLMPSLQAARACLEPLDVKVKHFLVLTDGIAGNEDAIIAYTAELAKQNITTSTVAVGEDAEQDFLKRIAAAGHGRHYSADRVRELPKVVLQETLVAAQRAMETEPFRATRRRPHPLLSGVPIEQAPVLHGLNPTKPKPLATVLLDGPREQPLLAIWEHGLGRSAAWTSDATGQWAQAWLSWPSFPKFVGQIARHLARREGGRDLSLELDAQSAGEDGVLVRAEARRLDGRFAEGLDLEACVLEPEGAAPSSASGATPTPEGRTVARERFLNTAPGRYEALVRGLAAGGYVVEARTRESSLGVVGFARACPAEYAQVGADRGALEAIAGAGGGTFDPAVLESARRAGSERMPVGTLLLLGAAFLVPIELAMRRLGGRGGPVKQASGARRGDISHLPSMETRSPG
jgi:Mg-chelatase subunit ChlD